MEWLKDLGQFILNSLLQEVIVVIASLLFVYFIYDKWVDWRYGRWHAVLIQFGKQVLDRNISSGKARQILNEPSDLSVFLKGLASPYAQVHTDLIEHGEKLGMLKIDRQARRITLDLDKDVPAANKRNQIT